MDEKKISVRNMFANDDSIVSSESVPSQARIPISRNKLKIKRWEAGLKQYELAFLLGCSAPYLSMVENNRAEATTEFKRKAAAIFETTVDDLFPRII
jgi:DNA-binding XRE family transcriptional regulator